MRAFFNIVDYDELTLMLADGHPVYVVDALTVSLDPEAGPMAGNLVQPQRMPKAPEGIEQIVLVKVRAKVYEHGLTEVRLLP